MQYYQLFCLLPIPVLKYSFSYTTGQKTRSCGLGPGEYLAHSEYYFLYTKIVSQEVTPVKL